MKKSLFFATAIALFWSLVFFASIYPNERQVRIPEEYPRIILETQPVDPRDLLRGDFVVLQYPFAQRWGEESVVRDILKNEPAGTPVYVSFSVEKDGRAFATSASTKKPSSGIFLAGKIYGKKSWNKQVRFGIESFFVPAGKGKELEKAQRERNLEAVVAVNPLTGKGLVTDLLVGKTAVHFEDIEPVFDAW